MLVDEADRQVGTLEKLEAHRRGALHRAISVFVFHTDGRIMLQRRATGKYHSAGLWSNACCSHPRPGEETHAAAARRLYEEMRLSCPLRHVHAFTYRVSFPNGLTEHEYDHVFVGVTDRDPAPDPQEADAWKWVAAAELQAGLAQYPERYTYWLRVALNDVLRAAGYAAPEEAALY